MLVIIVREENLLIARHYSSDPIFGEKVPESVLFYAMIREIRWQLRGISIVDPDDTMFLIEFMHLGAVDNGDLIRENLAVIPEGVVSHSNNSVLNVHKT